MAGCCCNESEIASQGLQARQKRMLWLVLAINAVMFVTEFTAGLIAGSTALLPIDATLTDACVPRAAKVAPLMGRCKMVRQAA